MEKIPMKLLILLLIFVSPGAYTSELKHVPIGKDREITYELPHEWSVFKKQIPPEYGVAAIRILTNTGSEILALFMVVDNDNPAFIKAKTPDQYIRTLHDGVCATYVKGSIEGDHPPRIAQLSDTTRLESVFTDKSLFSHKRFAKLNNSDGEYKYITILTWFIGDQSKGVAASVALLSNETSGASYDSALNAINSLRMK